MISIVCGNPAHRYCMVDVAVFVVAPEVVVNQKRLSQFHRL